MGRRISKEFLHPSILEGVNDKIGNLDSLETDAKGNMVQAINELVEKLDNSAEIENGKELIANAVGEPLTAEESFDEMSNDINSLLSTFKTNMMNNGVTVESSDRFKSLIDKIATMVEEGSGKGIQIVSGTLQDYVANTDTFNFFVKDSSNYTYDYASYVEIKDLSFRPSFVFINAYNEEGGGYIHNYAIVNNFNNNQYNNENNKPSVITGCSDVSSIGSGEAATYMADEKVFVDDSTIHVPLEFWSNIGSNIDYLIIGVGEEDTTLRDSLASILTDEGVSVTEEDNMASLITKVDEEFNDKENEAENTKNRLYELMSEGGYDVESGMSIDDLLGMLELSGINTSAIKQIACGAYHTFILKNDGSVWCCGNNSNGELGLNDTTKRTAFTQVTTNINNDVKQIACGDTCTFILKNDGSLWACGNNSNRQLGLGDSTNRTTFTQVTTNVNNDVKQVASGYNCTFIVKNDGSLWTCGYTSDAFGLGITTSTAKSTFTQVTTNINNDVEQVSCGENHAFIIKNDGSLWACGVNGNGELGLGDNTDRSTFTQVTTNVNNDVKQVSCGSYSTFILKNDGSLWSCGYNYSGHLGLDDTTDRSTFTQVTINVDNDVKCIYNRGGDGISHAVILKNDGSVWACGENGSGQLGLNDTTDRTTFTQVTTNINNDVKQIACGYAFTYILKNDGSVWACGANANGQLGLSGSMYKLFTIIPNGFSY